MLASGEGDCSEEKLSRARIALSSCQVVGLCCQEGILLLRRVQQQSQMCKHRASTRTLGASSINDIYNVFLQLSVGFPWSYHTLEFPCTSYGLHQPSLVSVLQGTILSIFQMRKLTLKGVRKPCWCHTASECRGSGSKPRS